MYWEKERFSKVLTTFYKEISEDYQYNFYERTYEDNKIQHIYSKIQNVLMHHDIITNCTFSYQKKNYYFTHFETVSCLQGY